MLSQMLHFVAAVGIVAMRCIISDDEMTRQKLKWLESAAGD